MREITEKSMGPKTDLPYPREAIAGTIRRDFPSEKGRYAAHEGKSGNRWFRLHHSSHPHNPRGISKGPPAPGPPWPELPSGPLAPRECPLLRVVSWLATIFALSCLPNLPVYRSTGSWNRQALPRYNGPGIPEKGSANNPSNFGLNAVFCLLFTSQRKVLIAPGLPQWFCRNLQGTHLLASRKK